MSSLSLKHIYKVYDGGVKAVNDFCMEIKDKEFIVFVGPSGCGKSTTLRMIAGLEEITAGELMIGDEVVNDVEPKDRNIAMVFQNYALYPHMTVRENMAFALRLSKQFTEEEIMKKVDDAAEVLDIKQFLDRKPRALSGGQRQRVSLGRAIVRQPKVFLLDEPLSNLDAKLRAQMRTEITKLHQKLATTFIYVTHDQVEAMTMGTRIVVMKLGVVQQIDTPQNLYRYPGNKFVAGFIGTPQMNFYDATLTKLEGGKVKVIFANDREIIIPEECVIKADAKYFDGKTTVTFGIRPEDIHFDEDFVKAHKETSLTTKTSIIEALGSESIVYCELDESNLDSVSESKTRMVLKVDPRIVVEKQETITIAIDPERIHLFDKETEKTIMPRIPEENVTAVTVVDGVAEMLGGKYPIPSAVNITNGKYDVHIPSNAFVIKDLSEATPIYDETHLTYSVKPDVLKKKQQISVVAQNVDASCFGKGAYELNSLTSAEVMNVEKINDKVLLRLNTMGNTLFAVGNESFDDSTKTIDFALDWKKIYFTEKVEQADSETGELKIAEKVMFPSLIERNVISAKLIKEKVGNTFSREYNFALNIAETGVFVTEYVKTKLFNAAGRNVFSVALDVDFDMYNALLLKAPIAPGSDSKVVDVATRTYTAGIPVKVKAIKDYVIEKLVECELNNKSVFVSLRKDSAEFEVGDTAYLAINVPSIGIVESNRGIRII